MCPPPPLLSYSSISYIPEIGIDTETDATAAAAFMPCGRFGICGNSIPLSPDSGLLLVQGELDPDIF
jgi:hypothetical protein